MTTQITGFGRDVWCGPNGLQTGRFAEGRVLLAHACYHRLRTPRGTLRGSEDAQNYGIDLADYIGAVGYPSAILTIPTVIRAELQKDDRVLDVEVTPTEVRDGALTYLHLEVEVTPADGSGAFRFTLRASDVTLELLGVVA